MRDDAIEVRLRLHVPHLYTCACGAKHSDLDCFWVVLDESTGDATLHCETCQPERPADAMPWSGYNALVYGDGL